MNNSKTIFKTLILIPVALFVFILSSCSKEDSIESHQTVLFQYEYENYAWVAIHGGWFIDNKGQVMGYNMATDWKYPDSAGYIAKDSLLQNYNQADILKEQMDLDDLLKKAKLIESSLDGELSELDCPGADRGVVSLYCYYWDDEKNKYKRQLLSMDGDCNQVNTSFQALKLIQFLNKYIE